MGHIREVLAKVEIPIIIAEIGINHNGDIDIAKKLIDMAVSCGCDAVKFQKRTVDKVYTPEFLASPRESPWGRTQGEQKEGLEFGEDEYDEIDRYCKGKVIPWFASAWDLDSQAFLGKYNLEYNKIASKMITNVPLLDMVAKERKHTFISTGIKVSRYIDTAVGIFRQHNCPFTLMHCVMKYPSPDCDCSLRIIKVLKARYDYPVGYSCHSPGILSPALAVALGAEAIEVHITLDRAMYGSDQASSLEKRGLEYIIRDCKRVGIMM